MSRLAGLFSRIETSSVAATVGQSIPLSGFISGVHLVGLTLIVGGVLLSSLRLLGIVLPDRSVADVTAAARRAIPLGIAISVATGLLLLAPRISTAVSNGIFQVKMLLLITATAFHFTNYHSLLFDRPVGSRHPKVAATLGLVLWCGVAVAGCLFILIE
jgi:hypothetical protein